MDEQKEQLNGIDLKNNNKTPLNITFSNISCKVICSPRKQERIILDNAAGVFHSGRLSGILGPSGAGKTTLLNILAGMKTRNVTGKILVNGQQRNLEDFLWQSSYIRQDTAMLPLLTTKETLMVAAELKLPSKMDRAQKHYVISEIVDLLGLTKALDTRASDLSGGELKRLSIGVELVTNPPVMFFDEPTSGLDSVSSCQVVAHLQNLARGGRTIICVIHQPSSHIFDMFDDILVVSNGKSIYGGPINNMVADFESSGFICPQYYNRADFALEVATYERKGDIESLMAKNLERTQESASLFNAMGSETDSTPAISECQVTVEIENQLIAANLKSDKKKHNTYAVSQAKQFCVLLKRSTISTFRDMQLTTMRLIAHIVVGIILGLIYYGIGDDASKIMSNSALLFFFLLFIFFANSMPTVLTFPLEASVFEREHQNKWYSIFAYFFSKIVADFPLQVICPTVFIFVAYYMSGQPCESFRMAMVWIVCVMFAILSQLTGLVTGVAITNMQMGIFLLPALSIPMLIFSGFFVRFDEVPGYMHFLCDLSYFGYGFEALMVATYGYNRNNLNCSTHFCYFKSPSKFLEEMDMNENNYLNDISVLGAWIIFLQLSLLIALMFRIWRSS